VFVMFKIFHYWLRRSSDKKKQTYLLVTIDTRHFMITSTNMTLKLKILPSFFLSFFLSFLLSFFLPFFPSFLERVPYLEDELLHST